MRRMFEKIVNIKLESRPIQTDQDQLHTPGVVLHFSVPFRARQIKRGGQAPSFDLAYPNGFEPLTFRVGV